MADKNMKDEKPMTAAEAKRAAEKAPDEGFSDWSSKTVRDATAGTVGDAMKVTQQDVEAIEEEASDPRSDARVTAIADMSSTIPGGAYLMPDRKTWVNADGEALSPAQVKEVKAHVSVRNDARDALSEAVKEPTAAGAKH